MGGTLGNFHKIFQKCSYSWTANPRPWRVVRLGWKCFFPSFHIKRKQIGWILWNKDSSTPQSTPSHSLPYISCYIFDPLDVICRGVKIQFTCIHSTNTNRHWVEVFWCGIHIHSCNRVFACIAQNMALTKKHFSLIKVKYVRHLHYPASSQKWRRRMW